MCSWSRAIRRPSDLGFDDGPFILPELIENEHVVQSTAAEGTLFAMTATSLDEERAERRATLEQRCSTAATLLTQAGTGVAWCHLNAEADMLESMMPGSAQISGSDSDERKEELFEAFRHGQLRLLVTKPKIAAFGMNWQHANTMTFFPDHSFEQYYQAIRRMWRFGQTRPVTVHNVTSQSLAGVTRNLRRKAEACEAMFSDMVLQMNDALRISRFREHNNSIKVPQWL
jgi:hypothetical protein